MFGDTIHGSMSSIYRRLLASRNFPWSAGLLAVLLCIRSLWLGWYADDYTHRAMLTRLEGPPLLARAPWDIFAFFHDGLETRLELLKNGLMPWWSDPQLRLAFFRPLASLSHWLDYSLWPESPVAMHGHSLLWFGAAVVAAGLLYRRLGPAGTAGLAALLFAVDDAHALPAMWLANRNASISLFFGALALVFHDRWRRENWRAGATLAPVSFLLSLLGSEMGIAVCGYLVGYALFVEPGNHRERLKSVLPILLVGAIWWVAYVAMGYGAAGSGLYIDPGGDPWRFLQAVLTRMPMLFWGQFGLSADLLLFLSGNALRFLWILAVALMLPLAWLFVPVLRSSKTACFWLTGFVLSLLPSCATFVSDRVLFFAGVGGMGFLAVFLKQTLDESRRGRSRRLVVRRTVAKALIFIHLILAPLSLLVAPTNLAFFRDVLDGSASTFPSDPSVTRQKVLIVSTPTAFVSLFAPLIQSLNGHPTPLGSVVLGSSIHGMEVSRPNDRTLVLRPDGGFLFPPGSAPGEGSRAPFDRRYVYSLLDWLFVGDPRRLERRIFLGDGIVVEILDVTGDGRPLEVAFHLDRPLESESLRWIRWHAGGYLRFDPPPIGGSVSIPPVELMQGPR